MKIYTDGSCDKKGMGGWAFLAIVKEKIVHEMRGNENSTTNNRMELLAMIKAFQFAGENVEIITDSQYVQKGLTEWSIKWEENNWQGTSGPVKNSDLWKQLLDLSREKPTITVRWERGHNGCQFNERADWLSKKR